MTAAVDLLAAALSRSTGRFADSQEAYIWSVAYALGGTRTLAFLAVTDMHDLGTGIAQLCQQLASVQYLDAERCGLPSQHLVRGDKCTLLIEAGRCDQRIFRVLGCRHLAGFAACKASWR